MVGRPAQVKYATLQAGAVYGRSARVRAAALDFGKVRVGAAISDDLARLAHPRPFFDATNLNQLLERVSGWIEVEGIETVVIGLPRRLDGAEGPAARRARRFARLLGQRVSVPIEMVDEWLTTTEARGRLRDQGLSDKQARTRVDSAAATVLLQSWLDSRKLREAAEEA